ncbi:MAG: hypothetical protein IT442_04225 [Phycisphaeraceae bacterium]|nr:hypothetical protein [Phycisphaeraceae bacterium]
MKRALLGVVALAALVLGQVVDGQLVEWPVEAGGNGHWYQAVLLTESVSWQDAKVLAENAGGYLATLTSQAENDFVFGLVQGEGFWEPSPMSGSVSTGPWLGGYQIQGSEEPAGGWVWVTGEVWDYTNWSDNPASHEPNNVFDHEDFLQFSFFYDHDGMWNDLPNDTTLTPASYIVEWSNPVPEPRGWAIIGGGCLVAFGRRARKA